jgi:hypothetical protein
MRCFLIPFFLFYHRCAFAAARWDTFFGRDTGFVMWGLLLAGEAELAGGAFGVEVVGELEGGAGAGGYGG